ncbi:MAG: SDR family NAD(P)-dependent oxidoreductase, partial [Sediminibacterium sp.]|nr:SDR family NAD(P)-dependent oxidoreductase [Sediminibacterium sp.]
MYALSQKYPHKRAFITGAASGLGKSFALELAAEGWTIGMADNNPQTLVEVKDLVTKAGGKPITYLLDVADKDQYKEVADRF